MNPIDQFRRAFYEKLIAEEQTKERQEQLKQRNCVHLYNREVPSDLVGFRQMECSKCGRVLFQKRNPGT
jgi:hypothetical protein